MVRDVFHDKFGLELPDEAAEEWLNFIRGLEDRRNIATGIMVHSPDEIEVSVSGGAVGKQQMGRFVESNKQVIAACECFEVVASEPVAVDSFEDELEASFTIAYTGKRIPVE